MDRKQLIDKLIEVLNALADADGIQKSFLVCEMYQMLKALRENIGQYEENQKQQIAVLEKQVEELNIQINGDNAKTVHIDLDPRRVDVDEQISKLQDVLMVKEA